MESRYIVGIDLGTTNSALGYVDLHDASPGSIRVLTFDIPQLVGHGRVAARPTLPSFLYLPGDYDLQGGVTALPWNQERDYAVGVFARDQGGLVPGRLVSSAKSWLCHGGVDREAPILPWGAGTEVNKVSPIAASSRYLQHLKEAWDHTMPEPLDRQVIVLTVPASFDEVARELTVQAAREAGLGAVTLLEEPLAAFYAWLSHHENDWNTSLEEGDLLLVCDVGGGTTDFTLVACEAGPDGPRLERVAVGDHLLLGGDNMDLTLAAIAEKGLGVELDPARWQVLYHQCRMAKETLLEDPGPAETGIRLAGRGRSLVAGTLLTVLRRDEVREALLEGFFPGLTLDQCVSAAAGDPGLREMGLPYVDDPAVTRHLARFLARQGGGRLPSAVLFNGGALKPKVVRERLAETLSAWRREPISVLESDSLDLAISWGAAYYGLVRRGLGLRVGGGMARSYFLGVEVEESAGETPRAVCLVERGTEEGREVEISRTFKVRTNRPVKFSLYSSTTRKGDRVGDLVPADSAELIRLPRLQTVLHYGKRGRDVSIPVRVGAKVTAIGTLELFCESQESPHRWRLQFQLRDSEAMKPPAPAEQVEGIRVAPGSGGDASGEDRGVSDEDREALHAAVREINRCFLSGQDEEALLPAHLPGRLTECMGMEKELWSLPLLRGLADALLEARNGRGRSPQHEARWYNLTGFCMRPGFGEVMDPWRIKKIWPLYFEGLAYARESEPRLQWWIFWRRAAGGLSSGQQDQIFSAISTVLVPSQQKGRRRSKVRPLKVSEEERREMWLFAANLERLDTARKIDLGRVLLDGLVRAKTWGGHLWTLSRIGARQPLYGPANKVVPPGEVARWLDALKKQDWPQRKKLIDAVVGMSRLTGDRSRDLQGNFRQEIRTWLQVLGAREDQIGPLDSVVALAGRERDQVYGESLPEGLVLAGGGEE